MLNFHLQHFSHNYFMGKSMRNLLDILWKIAVYGEKQNIFKKEIDIMRIISKLHLINFYLFCT